MRRQRAEEVGTKLSDTERWCSHSRGISMQVLKRDLKLEIEDIDRRPDVRNALENYYELLQNYLENNWSYGCSTFQGTAHPVGVGVQQNAI